MSNTLRLSEIIANRRSQGLPVDDAAIAGIRDKYLSARKERRTDVWLVDDLDPSGDKINWVVAPTADGQTVWQPKEDPLDETLLNDFINGLAPGFLEDPHPATIGEDPLGTLAGLVGMMSNVGGAANALTSGTRLGASTLGRMTASGAAMGAHSAATAASHGGDAGDVLKSGAIGAGLGAGLTGLHAVPFLQRPLASKAGEAALWGGLEKAMNPGAPWGEVAGMAVLGPMAGKMAHGPRLPRPAKKRPPLRDDLTITAPEAAEVAPKIDVPMDPALDIGQRIATENATQNVPVARKRPALPVGDEARALARQNAAKMDAARDAEIESLRYKMDAIERDRIENAATAKAAGMASEEIARVSRKPDASAPNLDPEAAIGYHLESRGQAPYAGKNHRHHQRR